MKILLLATGTVRSSLTARLVNIGREQVRRGHEVILIAPSSDKYTDFKRERLSKLEGMTIVQPAQLSTRFQALNFLPYLLAATWQAWRQQADIIHLYKPTPITIVGLFAGLRRRTKIVLDMDDLGSLVMAREGNPAWKVHLVDIAEHLAARYAGAIITASSYLRDYYRGLYPTKPILWVPNGVTALDPGSAIDAPPITFIGSLNDLSLITPLIDALPQVRAALPSTRPLLQIIGDGVQRPQLRQLVQSRDLEAAVIFSPGWISLDKLAGQVSAGTIGYCCVPDDATYRAASSQKVFNYLSLGVIPVVNQVGDLPHYVENGVSGYIVGADLAATLITALTDDAGRAAKLTAGRAYLEANFLWSTLAQRIETFYASQFSTSEVIR